MMSLRAVCLILGAILVSARPPLLWLWLSLCGVGMVLLPWLAVLLANDRPPKERHRLVHRRAPGIPREVTGSPNERSVRVIDGEP